ncbi:uncharacterized protein LOC130725276 [Lotus japonicus]|uniref:uncharacterized protein LOC130725276 n=1 Tax=Lotus japonicus TaxID=34305 RepID=UPI002586B7A5|nr:uncharacterized protein LOC130725276 [Lotus japonicus]
MEAGTSEVDNEHDGTIVVRVDLTKAFTTDKAFASHTDLIDWARCVGKENGYVVIVIRSDYGSAKRKPLITLGCERGGKYKPAAKVLKRSQTGTKKSDCPFRLRARPGGVDGRWKVIVHSGIHNHDSAETLQGHSFVGRLNPDEKVMVGSMIEKRVKPSDMLIALREKNPNNLTRIKQIYNEKQAYNRIKRGPFSEIQHLMKLLEGDKYAYWSRVEGGSNVIKSLFFAHPDSIHLFNEFPTVVLMDSTYKTNRYRIPLLEMVGVTSTNLTYSIAFAYMANERTDEVLWALNRLKGLIVKEENLPKVIVTDKDTVLMKVIEDVFPAARHLLCQFHVSKSVTGKLKTLIQSIETRVFITDIWNRLMHANSEADYLKEVAAMQVNACNLWPYLETNWFPLRHKFVKFEIDTCMHMGCTTTNRVEGAHSKLKKLLSDSLGDLVKAWTAVNKLLIMQHDKIKESYQLSIFVTEHTLNDVFYKDLRGFVSRAALHMIARERKQIGRPRVDGLYCGCAIRRTHGLPCACELQKLTFVPLLAVHAHWRKLNWDCSDPAIDPELGVSFESELEALKVKFDGSSAAVRKSIIDSIRMISFPERTSMCPPPKKVPTKGRQKGSSKKVTAKSIKVPSQRSTKRMASRWERIDVQYPGSWEGSNSTPNTSQRSTSRMKNQSLRPSMLRQIPEEFHPFIDSLVHVEGDGHCGFRCVAAMLDMGEDKWAIVRRTLI